MMNCKNSENRFHLALFLKLPVFDMFVLSSETIYHPKDLIVGGTA